MRYNFTRRWLIALFALIAIFLFLCSNSQAYFLNEMGNWRQNEIVFKSIFPQLHAPLTDGSTSWNQVAQAAADEWNYYLKAMGANLRITIQLLKTIPSESWDFWINEEATRFIRDGNNNIYFSLYYDRIDIPLDHTEGVAFCDRRYGYDQNYVKKDPYDQGDSFFKEINLLFHAFYQWDSYRTPGMINGKYDFYRVALHEMGHALGLEHPNMFRPTEVKSIMNTKYNQQLTHLHQDDINGIAAKLGLEPVPVAPQFAEPMPGSVQIVRIKKQRKRKNGSRRVQVYGRAFIPFPREYSLDFEVNTRDHNVQINPDGIWTSSFVLKKRKGRKQKRCLIAAYLAGLGGSSFVHDYRWIRNR